MMVTKFHLILLVSCCLQVSKAIIINCKYFKLENDVCLSASLKLALKCREEGTTEKDKCHTKYFSKYLQCIPEVPLNTTMKFPCSPYYFKEGEAEITCFPNKTFSNVDMESFCTPLPKELHLVRLERLLLENNITTGKLNKFLEERKEHRDRIDTVTIVLLIIDIVVCVTAFVLLLFLIPLKRKRIMLHRMLLLAFILHDTSRLVELYVFPPHRNGDSLLGSKHEDIRRENRVCNYYSLIPDYFFMTVVCWMFNEGFFQFRQFFFVFIQKSHIWVYFITGWAFPIVVVFGVYFPVMLIYPLSEEHTICWAYISHTHGYTFVLTGPIIAILFVNMLIMTYLMWIIWSKLKTGQPSELKNARKSARGFIVILVLLGGGYIFTIYGPDNCPEFEYFRGVVLPLQGFLVCIFHVFLSRELTEAISKKLRVISEADNLKSDASSTTRRLSLFGRYGSRNASVVSISSNGSRSRRVSRKESTGSYPSIDEVTEINRNIPIDNNDIQSGEKTNDNTEMAVVTSNHAYQNGDYPLANGSSVNHAYENDNNKQLFNIPENIC